MCHVFELSCAVWAETILCASHEPEFVFGGECACVRLEEAFAVCVVEIVCCLCDRAFDVLSGRVWSGHEVKCGGVLGEEFGVVSGL